MSRPKHTQLATSLEMVRSGAMTAAQAARFYGVAKSSISRALSAKVCECCGRVLKQAKPGN